MSTPIVKDTPVVVVHGLYAGLRGVAEYAAHGVVLVKTPTGFGVTLYVGEVVAAADIEAAASADEDEEGRAAA